MMQFTDSIQGNLELAKELLQGLPQSARPRCHRAAQAVLERWNQLKADNPKDPAVALGSVYALFFIADTIINKDADGNKAEADRLIITLNGE